MNEFLLQGFSDDVAAAKVDIIDNLPDKLSFPVEDTVVKWINDNVGETMWALCENHNVEIDFKNGKMHISGSRRGCENALSAIQSIIVAIPKPVKEKVFVPLDMVGLVSGPQFANKIRLESTYGIKVTIPAKGTGSNEILLEGLVDQVAAAKVDILENLFTLKEEIDGRFIRSIIGQQREGLNRLSKDHGGVRIKFEDGKTVIITGKKEHCESALRGINGMVAKLRDDLPVTKEQDI